MEDTKGVNVFESVKLRICFFIFILLRIISFFTFLRIICFFTFFENNLFLHFQAYFSSFPASKPTRKLTLEQLHQTSLHKRFAKKLDAHFHFLQKWCTNHFFHFCTELEQNVHQVLTRDSVTVSVDAVVYYRLNIRLALNKAHVLTNYQNINFSFC